MHQVNLRGVEHTTWKANLPYPYDMLVGEATNELIDHPYHHMMVESIIFKLEPSDIQSNFVLMKSQESRISLELEG